MAANSAVSSSRALSDSPHRGSASDGSREEEQEEESDEESEEDVIRFKCIRVFKGHRSGYSSFRRSN